MQGFCAWTPQWRTAQEGWGSANVDNGKQGSGILSRDWGFLWRPQASPPLTSWLPNPNESSLLPPPPPLLLCCGFFIAASCFVFASLEPLKMHLQVVCVRYSVSYVKIFQANHFKKVNSLDPVLPGPSSGPAVREHCEPPQESGGLWKTVSA